MNMSGLYLKYKSRLGLGGLVTPNLASGDKENNGLQRILSLWYL